MELTRRDFLKLVGAGIGAGVAGKLGLEAWEAGYEGDSTAGKIRRLILGPIPEFPTDADYLKELLLRSATTYASFFAGGDLVKPEFLIGATHFLSKVELGKRYQELYPNLPVIKGGGAFTYKDESTTKIYIPKDPWNDAELRKNPLIPGVPRPEKDIDSSRVNRVKVLDHLIHEFGHGQVEGRKFYPWYKFEGFGSSDSKFIKEKADPNYLIASSGSVGAYIIGFDGFIIYAGSEYGTSSMTDLEEAMAEWESDEFGVESGLSNLLPPAEIFNYRRSRALGVIIDRLGIDHREIMQVHHNSDGEKLIDLFSSGISDSKKRVERFLQIVSLVFYAGEESLLKDPIPIIREQLDQLLKTGATSHPFKPEFVKWDTPEITGIRRVLI